MEQLYKLTEDDLVLYCRKKKTNLTFVSQDEKIHINISYTRDNRLSLEECIFATNWSYVRAMYPTFTTWIHNILNICFTMAFYCFPQCSSIEIPYVWNLLYSVNEPAVAWSLGVDHVSCTSLPPLKADIDECEDVPVNWYPVEAIPTLDSIVLQYA